MTTSEGDGPVDARSSWFAEAVELHHRCESEAAYQPIWTLIDRSLSAPTTAFEIAVSHIESSDASERAVAADTLGQLGCKHGEHHRPALRHLMALADHEADPDVQWSIIFALSHLADPASLPVFVRFARNEDADVRYQVAQGIPRVASPHGRDSAVRALLELSSDPDARVRDQAEKSVARLSRT